MCRTVHASPNSNRFLRVSRINLLPLRRPPHDILPRVPLLTLHKVTLLDLVLPQVIGAIPVLARAAWVRAAVDLGRARGVLQLLVLGHAAWEPSGVALGSVAADVATAV